MHQAAAMPPGSPQECNPARGTAAGATQARRAGLAPEATHAVHAHARTPTNADARRRSSAGRRALLLICFLLWDSHCLPE